LPETTDLEAVLADVFRREWSRLVSTAVRVLGDLDAAEEVVQESLVAALDRWPFSGVPDNPGAWLTVTTRNRALNRVRSETRARRRETLAASASILDGEENDDVADPFDPADPAAVPDDRLGLILTCCHPVLSQEAQVALTLRLIAGLTTPEIARAFVVPEATVAQRIVRAKRLIRERRIPYLAAGRDELADRLPSVLDIIYLIFNEGYLASAGERLIRGELCDEGRRLAELLAELVPEEPEVHALVALLAFQASRRDTRVDGAGELVPLEEQDRAQWDRALIAAGVTSFTAALARGGRGPFTWQAAIAGTHASAASWEATDWPAILHYYDELRTVMPSPVVELNRAVALCLTEGPEAALATIDRLALSSPVSPGWGAYHPLVAARADFLRRLHRDAEAAEEYRRAAVLTANEVEARFLLRRADECTTRASRREEQDHG
jgi:RNA polymerase sigma-70 factor (ECF subfamily)